jgi:Ca2+-binding EF-hand superfamily protein
MMIGYFNIAVARDSDAGDNAGETGGGEPGGGDLRSRMLDRLQAGTPKERAERLMAQFDADRDGKVKRGEVPERYRRVFDLLDRAGDGELTEQGLVDLFSRVGRN